MGQYWKPVNLDKREYIHPHKLGGGLKLIEQACSTNIGAALVILCAAMPVPRGGGDLDNRTEVAQRIIGRWAGDRIALVGDYAEDGDLKNSPVPASKIYGLCGNYEEPSEYAQFTDISEDVLAVLRGVL